MIRIQQLSRSFGRREVLRGISLDVMPGEAVAVTGPNGAGKTTLLRVLATLLAPTGGEAWIAGHSVTLAPERIKAIAGFVPASDGGFFPRLTGRENLELFAALRRISATELARRSERWLSLPVVAHALETPFYLCSSGMKQALAICRALIGNPEVLLLDEPTRSLDRESALAVRAMLMELGREKTLLFATHSDAEIEALATRELRLGREGNA